MPTASLGSRIKKLEQKQSSKPQSIQEALENIVTTESLSCGDIYLYLHQKGFSLEEINQLSLDLDS